MARQHTIESLKANTVQDESAGCWLWQGGKTSKGYGRTRHCGRLERAHRLMLTLAKGQAPDGKPCALHGCDTPACCSPDHLYWGSAQDNTADKLARGRAAHVTGESNGKAKLTVCIVAFIKAVCVTGCREYGGAAMARRFGVSQALVSSIRSGKLWPHITPDASALEAA